MVKTNRKERSATSKYVGVCSKHFRDDDFIACSKDTNTHRKRSSPSLKKRYFKADAIPSIFPEVSGHFPTPVPARRSGKATSESRLNADIIAMENLNEHFFDNDKIINFSDLQSRSKIDQWVSEFTSDWAKIYNDEQIQFMVLKKNTNGLDYIASSLLVSKDLSITISSQSQIIPSSDYQHLSDGSKHLTLFSQFVNLLAFIKSLSAKEVSLKNKILQAADELLDCARENDIQQETMLRLEFLCKQLQLLTHESNFSLRYSPKLITTSYLLYFSSPYAYKVMR